MVCIFSSVYESWYLVSCYQDIYKEDTIKVKTGAKEFMIFFDIVLH